jgi:sigma-B regulation protein RsbU (phosphoserine phosphatase)
MPSEKARSFYDQYTQGVTSAELHRLFTRDTSEAYRYFSRGIDLDALAAQPWYRRWPTRLRLLFVAFSMRLSPPRRVLYAVTLISSLIGLLNLFQGFALTRVLVFPFTLHLPLPRWADGTLWLLVGFIGANLLILMEVADRLSLKGDLEIARDIQLAMLPGGVRHAGDATISGVTRPANTVGGDFYDVIELPDGRLVLALGDVAGKGSPAALLMALLLAMLRTLVDEGLELARLIERLNAQVARHAPASRFITLFCGIYDPRDGTLSFVNAGHLPPIVRRQTGTFERAEGPGGGPALGMFDRAAYAAHQIAIHPGDVLVLFSDGITEAEDRAGRPFDEAGLEAVIAAHAGADPDAIGREILTRVEAHAGDAKLGDDLTALVLKRT